MITLTIDEKKVCVPEGTTILKAAQSAGIYIPTLCYHAKLSPIGACRICLVEVEGEKRPVASCDNQVREGMVVRTDSEEIIRQRKQMLQFVLLNHPLDCPVCDKAGECHVQDMTVNMSVLAQQFTAPKPEKTREDLSPVLDIWHTRCIICGRCVQICKEIQGARAIDYVVRSGYTSKIGPSQNGGYACESCGQCLSVCPVGAIIDRTFRYSARAWQLKKVNSICTSCGVGCSYELNVRNNKVLRVTDSEVQGINRGNLCSAGRFGEDAIHSELRLTAPAIRRNGSLQTVSWDEALDYAAQRLKEIVSKNEGDTVAGLASARCTNEALFAFQRLMREGLGTKRVDTPSHLTNNAIIDTMTEVYGVPAPTATLSDIDEADVILVVDSNIVSTHPVAALQLLRAHRAGTAQVLVVGHRSNKLTTQCAHYARTLPGSETALLNSLANLLVSKNALNNDAIEKRAEGYDKLKVHLVKYGVADSAARTGVDADIISDMANAIAGAKKFLLVLSPGSLQTAINPSAAHAAVNLAVLKAGKVLSLLREGNAQGALDMGLSPYFLPGYKEAAISQNGSGVPTVHQGIESGEIKALYLAGGDIQKEMALLGLPLEVLRRLEVLIVQDVFASPVAELAHVVLPACSSTEREGSYTNAFRNVQHSAKAIQPIGQCRSDLEIISQLGQRLGLAPIESVEAARAQIAQAVPIYDFVNVSARLSRGEPWDYAKIASGARHKLSLVVEGRPATDDTYQFLLTFDNMLHYAGSSSMHSPSLAKLRVDEALEISEDDAKALRIENGAMVVVKVKDGGSVKLPARLSTELPARVVSVPSHNFRAIQALIGKLDASLLRSEEGTPAWAASVMPAKG
jgi:predicted molibdopterin-dependent oxidoreductase YjgC